MVFWSTSSLSSFGSSGVADGRWTWSFSGDPVRPLADEKDGFFKIPFGRILPELGWCNGGGELRTSAGMLMDYLYLSGLVRGVNRSVICEFVSTVIFAMLGVFGYSCDDRMKSEVFRR